MNILKKILFAIMVIVIVSLLIFFTVTGKQNNAATSLHFKDVSLVPSLITQDEKGQVQIKEINSEKYIKNEKNDIFVKNISQISRVFSDTLVPQAQENKAGNYTINIVPGIYLFDFNDVKKDFQVNSPLFSVNNLGPGKFFINNDDTTKTLVFSLDTIINLDFKNINGETISSSLLYPHSYIIFNQNKNLLIKNGDILKISSIFTLDFFYDKFFGDNTEVQKKLLTILSINNNDTASKIANIIDIVKKTYIQDEKDFQKYIKNSFIPLPGENLIKKYFAFFINPEKKKIYYKNIILQNIVALFNNEKIDPNTLNIILENINTLKELGAKDDLNEIYNMIEYYYKNKLGSNIGTPSSTHAFYELLEKNYNITHQNKHIESLLLLNNIFIHYDFHPDDQLLKNIASFKEQYFGVSQKEKMSTKDTEAFLFFIEKLLTHQYPEEHTYMTQISILLKDYTQIATLYYTDSADNIKKTGLFKNGIILDNLSNLIFNNFFNSTRNNDGLLERQERNKISRENLASIKNSVQILSQFYKDNQYNFDITKNNDATMMENYKNNLQSLEEYFYALADYEQYKTQYSKDKNILIDGQSIGGSGIIDETLSVDKAEKYLKTFNGITFNNTKISLKSYSQCNGQQKSIGESVGDIYCYAIENLDVNGSILSFFLTPNDDNKIDHIIVQNETKKGSYKLDLIKTDLNEKANGINNPLDKEKYDFANFFINTFTSQTGQNTSISQTENNTNTEDNEDKITKVFKRTKLLSDTGDFSIIKNFFNVTYNDISVTKKGTNYLSKIKNAQLNISVLKGNNSVQYNGLLDADYIFLPNHSFQNINIKIRDNTNKDKEIYLCNNTPISIIGEIYLKDLEEKITPLLSSSDDLNAIYSIIEETLSPSKIKIKYTPSLQKNRFEVQYNNKDIILYLEKGKISGIYYDGNIMINNAIDISGLKNILLSIQ